MQTVLGVVLIPQGLFLLFALAFNGTVGETFVNYSFFISSLIMVILGGIMLGNKAKRHLTIYLSLASLILYLPMIWQRYNYTYCSECTISYLDIWVILILLISLLSKPNKAFKRDAEKASRPLT